MAKTQQEIQSLQTKPRQARLRDLVRHQQEGLHSTS